MKSSSTIEKAKAALWAQFAGPKDGKGYTPALKDNPVPGVRLEQFQDDLLQGHGNELESKQIFIGKGRLPCIQGTDGRRILLSIGRT
jgi:hypothetical protein